MCSRCSRSSQTRDGLGSWNLRGEGHPGHFLGLVEEHAPTATPAGIGWYPLLLLAPPRLCLCLCFGLGRLCLLCSHLGGGGCREFSTLFHCRNLFGQRDCIRWLD